MRTPLAVIATLALMIFPMLASADEITIGTGTGTWNWPLSTWYHDARTQTIYLSSEIGSACRITALSLDVTTVPGQTMNNFTIRMRHTSLSSYSTASWESTGWTTVYQTNQTISGTGWKQFTFTTPFDCNGTDNLMVDISFNNSNYTSDGYCRYSTPGGNRSIYFRTDSGYGDPLTWSGTSNPTPSSTTAVPNIKLQVESLTIVSTPTFAPNGGTYDSAQNVVVSCGTPGATIRYSTDGIDPDTEDPIVVSGGTVSVDHTLTLKAKAWKDGLDPSQVKSADFALVAKTPTFSPDAGSYSVPQNVAVSSATAGATIHYSTDGIDPDTEDPIVVSGGTVSVDHTLTLKAKAWKDGLDPSQVKSADYSLTVATPTFDPEGGSYASAQTVAVMCLTPDASIHYTMNGDEPDEGDPTVASGSTVSVDHNLTLKAKAFRAGWTASDTKSAAYLIRGMAMRLYVNKDAPGPDHDGSSWDAAFLTVTDALSYSMSGDEVWVAKGTYTEHITTASGVALYGGFAGTETSLAERPAFPRTPPDADETVLDGNGEYFSVVTIPSGAGTDTRVDGFTIKNGRGTGDYYNSAGGGVYSYDASPTIANNLITGNMSINGGGVYCYGGSPVMSGNTISSNSAQSEYGGYSNLYGGGICCANCTATISNNVITGNTASSNDSCIPPTTPYGGGIYASGGAVTILGNRIEGNSASAWGEYEGYAAYGGGIYLTGGSPVVRNNTIKGNHADASYYSYMGGGGGAYSYGGGILCENCSPVISGNLVVQNQAGASASSYGYPYPPSISASAGGGGISLMCYGNSAIITNNTIASNNASYSVFDGMNNSSGGFGGGIYGYFGASSQVANNILAFNTNGGIYSSGTAPSLHSNDVFQNYGNDYSGVSAGTGDISADPLFVNKSGGDYHLSAASPCIEAGWDSAPEMPSTDIDGETRPYLDHVDIGADEFVGAPQVQTPVFSPGTGTYSLDQDVVVTCGTPGAVIHYTTSGDDPTELDPTVTSGASILVDVSLTLKARAFKSGWTDSAVKSAQYTLKISAMTFSPDDGAYPVAQNVVVSCPTPGVSIHYTIDNDEPDESDPVVASGSTVLVDHTLTLKAKAFKTGWTASDTKSARYIIRPVGRVHVDKTAPGPDHDGVSWGTAFLTVAEALHYSIHGDEVWVAKGTYSDQITLASGVALYGGFAGTETSLAQRPAFPRASPDANETVLDGWWGVTSPQGAGNDTRIDGFKITGGCNGGVYCADSYPTITNNTITGNYTSLMGGGIYCSGGAGSAQITKNKITSNSAGSNPYGVGDGGGIYCDNSHPVISGNSITGNYAVGWYTYDPFYPQYGSAYSGHGGGICCSNASPTITNNVISGNSAYCGWSPCMDSGTGNAISLTGGSGQLTNNTITANDQTGQGGAYESVYCSGGSPAISNNIIACSSYYYPAIGNVGGTPILRNNDVYNNGGNPYSGVSPGLGDMSAYPELTSSFHLNYYSPCINAGWNEAPSLPSTDMDGEARIQCGAVDIGADEKSGLQPALTTLQDAVQAADNTWVDLTATPVSAAFTNSFYIQGDARGMRVDKVGHLLDDTMSADVDGVVRTNADGERYLYAQTAEENGPGEVTPMCMINRSLGGEEFGLQQGIPGTYGLNNIGLLVCVMGRVTEVSYPSWFEIDDGSGRMIKCVAEDGNPVINPAWEGHCAVVTGISSCEYDGSNLVSKIRMKKYLDPVIY
jgi:hypothetical protein